MKKAPSSPLAPDHPVGDERACLSRYHHRSPAQAGALNRALPGAPVPSSGNQSGDIRRRKDAGGLQPATTRLSSSPSAYSSGGWRIGKAGLIIGQGFLADRTFTGWNSSSKSAVSCVSQNSASSARLSKRGIPLYVVLLGDLRSPADIVAARSGRGCREDTLTGDAAGERRSPPPAFDS